MTKSEKMLAFAREQRGELYDHGDHGSDLWDCSGLTMEMVKLVGKKWPHSSHSQYYNNIKPGRDFDEYGEIKDMPKDKDVFLFKYGERTSGKGMGMIHVGAYDGKTKTEIQAGGRGPIVNKEVYQANLAAGMSKIDAVNNSLSKDHPGGTRKSVVWEQAFNKNYWTHWGRGAWMDEEYGESTPDVPQEPQEGTQATLRVGSEGELVKALQHLLNQRGAGLAVDGKFGSLTHAAVRAFQARHELEVDGIAGPITWNALLPDEEPEEEPQEEPKYQWVITATRLTTATDAEIAALLAKFPSLTAEKQS